MVSVVREMSISASAEDCWAALRDFGALHTRLAPGFVTDCLMVDSREREITFSSGAVAREFLVGTDDPTMRLAYSVTLSPMGSTHHNASAQIVRDGPASCRFIWITDVLPDELAGRTAELMEAGLRVIKENLEPRAPESGGKARPRLDHRRPDGSG